MWQEKPVTGVCWAAPPGWTGGEAPCVDTSPPRRARLATAS